MTIHFKMTKIMQRNKREEAVVRKHINGEEMEQAGLNESCLLESVVKPDALCQIVNEEQDWINVAPLRKNPCPTQAILHGPATEKKYYSKTFRLHEAIAGALQYYFVIFNLLIRAVVNFNYKPKYGICCFGIDRYKVLRNI